MALKDASWSPVVGMENRALELAGLSRDEAFEIDAVNMMVSP